jgi:helicase associated protein
LSYASGDYSTDSGSVQRQKRDKLTSDRPARLESLRGWSWDPYADQWENAFKMLEEYTSEHRSSRVPYSYELDGFRLGVWVYEQRSQYAKAKLNPMPQKRLEGLRGWTWTASR